MPVGNLEETLQTCRYNYEDEEVAKEKQNVLGCPLCKRKYIFL